MAILEATNLTKTFPGVIALESVNIAVEPGQIHCVVGENGAGKSTLIKCLTGVHQPDTGRILINGIDTRKSPEVFRKIAYVPQEIDLFPKMSVAENLFLPFERHGIGNPIQHQTLCRRAEPLLERFHLDVDPGASVDDIPVSAQQRLQCVRAIAHEDYDILVLDEPTASLTTRDVELLIRILRDLKTDGKAIVFISHKLDEVLDLGDFISIFRNGRNVAFGSIDKVDVPWIVAKMTGKEIELSKTYLPTRRSEQVLLSVQGLSGQGFSDVSFELHSGEILGFSGLVGAGRSEVMQTILGIRPAFGGVVRLDGEILKPGNPTAAVERGFIYLPEERKKQAILPTLSLRENIAVTLLDLLRGAFGVSMKKECSLALEIIEAFSVKTSGLETEVRYLSGGNQQKVIIGRAMRCGPKVLVFDEPTRGIDVGTKSEIYSLMKELADSSEIGIILVSSEMDEVMKCSNRIITLYDGSITGDFEQGVRKETIMRAILEKSTAPGART